MISARLYILTTVVLLFINSTIAQNVEQLIGRAFNDTEVQAFIDQLDSEPIESFIPFRKSYLLSFTENGVELEFNSDMSLYQVNLYDSGFTFNRYTLELPFKAQWGQDSVSIQNKTGLMNPVAQNPFIKFYSSDSHTSSLYFKNGKLEMMKLVAKPDFILEAGKESVKQWGIRLLPDGKAVQGNVIDGEGVMIWGVNAASYEGEWSYGLPHGVGVYIDSFGNKYAGEFKLGFFWGAGSYYSSYYKYSYDGGFIMGRRHGQGIIKYTNGTSYNGEWDKDQMHGVGQYTLGESYYYQGEMRNNMFNGKGILTTPEGYIKGKFKNGKPHGYCEQYGNQSGQTLSGYWKDGLKHGEFNMNAFGYDRKMYFENDIEIISPNSEN